MDRKTAEYTVKVLMTAFLAGVPLAFALGAFGLAWVGAGFSIAALLCAFAVMIWTL